MFYHNWETFEFPSCLPVLDGRAGCSPGVGAAQELQAASPWCSPLPLRINKGVWQINQPSELTWDSAAVSQPVPLSVPLAAGSCPEIWTGRAAPLPWVHEDHPSELKGLQRQAGIIPLVPPSSGGLGGGGYSQAHPKNAQRGRVVGEKLVHCHRDSLTRHGSSRVASDSSCSSSLAGLQCPP